MKLNFKRLHEKATIPCYQTSGSSGMDLTSVEEKIIEPGTFKLIKTGLSVEVPEGCEAQIRPRSGLAYKFGITVLNSPGTIDQDYRGEVGVILINHGIESYKVSVGDRIAQMVICPYTKCNISEVEDISNTERGSGGFGHTGK